MPLELILVPDLFVPSWTRGSDYVYLVFQPLLLMPEGDSQVALGDYLKGFQVPHHTVVRQPVTVRLIDVSTDGDISVQRRLIPVPWPDTIRLMGSVVRGDGTPIPSGVFNPWDRNFGTFATLSDYAQHIRANHIFPARFSSRLDAARKQNWWIREDAPSDQREYQPEQYDSRATYAQILCHQMLETQTRQTTRAEPGVQGDFQQVAAQLQLAFGVGRPLRLLTDAGQNLFEQIPGTLADQLMIIPDLAPGDSWHDVLDNGGASRRLTNVHSLCGLVWPLIRRDQLLQLGDASLPSHVELRVEGLEGSGQSVTFSGATGVLTFPPRREDDDPDERTILGEYLKDLRDAASTPAPRLVASPLAHLGDLNHLVFAIPKSRHLAYEARLTHGLTLADATIFVHRQDEEGSASRVQKGETDLLPLAFLDATAFRSLSILSSDRADLEGSDVQIDLLMAIPGRLTPFRRFQADDRRLFQFQPNRVAPDPVLASLHAALSDADSVVHVRLLAFDQTVVKFTVEDLRENYVGEDSTVASTPPGLRPILFFTGTAQELEALDAGRHDVVLLFPAVAPSPNIQGAWSLEPFKMEDGSANPPDLYLWRSGMGWPMTGSVFFNAVRCNRKRPEPDGSRTLGMSLTYRTEYEFQFARSARQVWMAFELTYPPNPPNLLGVFDDDNVEDAWSHKELNVFLSSAPGAGRRTMLNPDSLNLPGVEVETDETRRRRFGAWIRQELTDVEAPATRLAQTFPDPPQGFTLRFTHWPPVLPLDPPSLWNYPPEPTPETHLIRLGLEHHYSTQLFPEAGDGGPFTEGEIHPWIDWPFTNPARLRKPTATDDEPRVTAIQDEFFLQFLLPTPDQTATSHVTLLIRSGWLDDDQRSDPMPTDDDRRRAREARRAALDLVGAATIVLELRGFVFDLATGEDPVRGTGHDRRFRDKMRCVTDPPIRLTLGVEQRASLNQALDPLADRETRPPMIELDFALEVRLHEIATIVECDLIVSRPPALVPPVTPNGSDLAQTRYEIRRPRLELLPITTEEPIKRSFTEVDLLDSADWNRFFEPLGDFDEVQTALARWITGLGELRTPLMPLDDRSSEYRTALQMLAESDAVLAPPGFLIEPTATIRHALTPLAFLPLPQDPGLLEASTEIFTVLLQTLDAYEDLALADFALLDRDGWRALLTRPGQVQIPGRDALASALAATLQPIARPGGRETPNLSSRLADQWRFVDPPADPIDDSVPWTPTRRIRDLIVADLNTYVATKAFLVHALKPSDPDPLRFPPYFYRMRVAKEVNDQGALRFSSQSRDVDLFTYRTTATHRPDQPEDETHCLLTGDLLDDLTYDDQFEVREVRYESAEQFVEQLGTGEDGENDARDAGPIRLIATGLELPFGGPKPPGNEAIVPLIARRPLGRPTIVFQELLPQGVEFGNDAGESSKCLRRLEDLSRLPPVVSCTDTNQAAFARTSVRTTPAWDRVDDFRFVDVVRVGLLITLSADEEGQLERDLVWLRTRDFDERPEGGPILVEFPMSIAPDQIRIAVPEKTSKADVEAWLDARIVDWMTDLATASLHAAGPDIPSLETTWREGYVRFRNDQDVPKLQELQLDPGASLQELRVSHFRPLHVESPRGQGATHLLAIEVRVTAGQSFRALGVRQVRNARIAGFEPDPRFTLLTNPASRPDPIVASRVHDFADRQTRPTLTEPVLIPPDGLDRAGLRAELERLGVAFQSPSTLLEGLMRVAVYHADPNPAPRIDFDETAGGAIDDDAHRRPFREPKRVFRFDEPNVDGGSGPDRITLPELHQSFVLDVHCLTSTNTSYLQLVNIPVRRGDARGLDALASRREEVQYAGSR